MSKLKAKNKTKKVKKTSSKKSLKAKKISRPKKTAKLKAKKTVKVKKTPKKKTTVKKSKVKKAVKANKIKKQPKSKAKKAVKIKAKKSAPKKTVRPARPVRLKKAVKTKDLFNAKEMKEIIKQLKELRASLIAIVKTKKELDLVEQDTGDVIDIASQSLDKEMLFELSGNEIAMLEDVDSALRRIDNNVFGLCEYCRKPIRKLRIKAIPQARYCLACQSGNEQPTKI
ncbi:MAG: TraR/DksA family transcriptional regulator [Elusimicrobiota bacterium]|nr:TraR/DksA family transcriptional regulator [Elusimicrobiota bacterium]